jgi:hypothetical protein
MLALQPVQGVEPPLPGWVACLPDPEAAKAAWELLKSEWQPLEAAVDAMAGKGGSRAGQDGLERLQREALLKVHTRLQELEQERRTPYPAAFEAYMLHAGGRCASQLLLPGAGAASTAERQPTARAQASRRQSLTCSCAGGPPPPPRPASVTATRRQNLRNVDAAGWNKSAEPRQRQWRCWGPWCLR